MKHLMCPIEVLSSVDNSLEWPQGSHLCTGVHYITVTTNLQFKEASENDKIAIEHHKK